MSSGARTLAMDPLRRLLRLLGMAEESAAQPAPAAPAPAPAAPVDPRTRIAPPPPAPDPAALAQEVIRLRKALAEAERAREEGEAQIGRNRVATERKLAAHRQNFAPPTGSVRVSPAEMAEETRANREALAAEEAAASAAEEARREANALATLPPAVRLAATADPAALERLRRLAANPATAGALRLPEAARRALRVERVPPPVVPESGFVARPRSRGPRP